MTGTHFPDRTGLGSATNGYRPHLRRLDCALVHIFLVRFGRYNDPDGHPFVAKFDRDRDTTGEAERIGENEITPSEPPFPARR